MSGAETTGRPYAAYGWIIIAGSIAAVAGMSVHPSGGPSVMATVRALAEDGEFNMAVHFVLIGTYLVLVLGFLGLSDWLGRDRLLVRGGLIAYLASTLAGIAAAISGPFVMRTVAIAYAGAASDKSEYIVSAFRVAGALNFAWGRMWMIALSAAILFWSIELLTRSGAARLLGWGGLMVGIVGFFGISLALIPLTPGALVYLVFAQTAWSVGAGSLLLRHRI